jgi:hypothetical protein
MLHARRGLQAKNESEPVVTRQIQRSEWERHVDRVALAQLRGHTLDMNLASSAPLNVLQNPSYSTDSLTDWVTARRSRLARSQHYGQAWIAVAA